MVGQTKPEVVHQRHQIHVEELREFFASRDVAYGAAENLPPFAAQLTSDEALAEEMGSLIRSILYQEERIGRGELLGIVVRSVAGRELNGDGTEYPDVVRQLFGFVNTAVHQTHSTFAELPETEEEDKDLDLPSEVEPGEHQLSPQSASRFSAPPVSAPPVAATPSAQGRGDVLYRAMALSAEQDIVPADPKPQLDPKRTRVPHSSRPWWAIPAFGLTLAALVGGVYVLEPRLHRARAGQGAINASFSTEAASVRGNSCAAPIAAGATRSGLEERSLWAHNLLSQGLYDAALPELREIARLDPGFPGVRLDESDTLLHLKRPEEARDAINAQISISECLGALPPASMDAYCTMQYGSPSREGCRLQMTHIRQAAELQAALVHLELGHQVEPDASAAAALAELSQDLKAPPPVASVPKSVVKPTPKAKHADPLPPATEGDTAQPPLARDAGPQTSGKKGSRDNSLVRGEGTDSAYGAYQKSQH